MKFFIIFIILKYSLTNANSLSSQTSSNAAKFLDENEIKCTMYSTQCYQAIYIPNSQAVSNLKLTSLDTDILQVLRIEPCERQEFLNSPIIKHIHCARLDTTRNVFLVHLNPMLIGKTFLKLGCKSRNCSVAQRSCLVAAPQRFIDKFLQGYIIAFSALIAALMGIMMDWEIIKKIIKLPKPVAIGFSAQYILMPLVIII